MEPYCVVSAEPGSLRVNNRKPKDASCSELAEGFPVSDLRAKDSYNREVDDDLGWFVL